MRANDVFGIVFANVHDDLINELTSVRNMASIPFGSRYRLIDFSISNLVNAGVSRVAVMTQTNYRSLMDHLGNGKAWDLDRKTNGLYILPPFNIAGAGYSVGHIDSLNGSIDFIKESPMQYAVLCDADVVSNIDLNKVFKAHTKSGADITFCYKHGPLPKSHRDIMSFAFDKDNYVTDIRLESQAGIDSDFCLDIIVISKDLLIELATDAYARGGESLSRDVFQRCLGKYKMYGYEVTSYAAVMDSPENYVKANHDLLDYEIRKDLFNPERPVYTKPHDSMPTRYGPDSLTQNSLIADGCIIEGTVRNSILFRNVHVAKGTVVENCILMQDTVVEENANIKHITADKNVTITAERRLCGSPDFNLFIRKGAKV